MLPTAETFENSGLFDPMLPTTESFENSGFSDSLVETEKMRRNDELRQEFGSGLTAPGDTRWMSNLDMIKAFQGCHVKLGQRIDEKFLQLKSEFESVCSSLPVLTDCGIAYTLLKTVIMELQGDSEPTANLILPNLAWLELELKKLQGTDTTTIIDR
uniref:Uncharacterized protein n=1 Tax=Ditylenchus dipsaci TaxID=166011 RepID=A0A915E480_9BILA